MKRIITACLLLLSLQAFTQVQIVTLDASASKDTDGTIVKWKWQQVGVTPSATKIANDTLAKTTVVPANGAQWMPGTYIFQITVTDNGGASSTAQTKVTWNASAPIANAGTDQTIQLPGTVTLQASAMAALGIIKVWSWSQVSGPNTAIFNRKDTSRVIVSSLAAGIYTFQINVTDNFGQTSFDQVTVAVKPVNQLPVINAGPDQNLTLPNSSTTIGGADIPSNLAITWRKVSGGTAYIQNPFSYRTVVSQLQAGTYVFEKKANESNIYDTVTVTVKKKCTWLQRLFGKCK